MSKLVVIASNGLPYSVYKLHQVADKIVSDRVSVRVFDKELGKIITGELSIQGVADFMKEVKEQDLRKKILLDPNGYVLGGELGIIKALFLNKETVRIVRFKSWDDMQTAHSPNHRLQAHSAETHITLQ